MPFDFDSETRRRLGYKLIDRIDEYFSGLAQRPVQLPEELRTFADLGEPLPEFGQDAATVLDNLCSEMTAQGFHVPSANYFGLMNPYANLHGGAGGSAGGCLESATRQSGPLPACSKN